MITMTEFAKTKLKEISDSEGIGHYTVRLKLIGSGCAGFSQDMNFEEIISDLDEVLLVEDIKIIIDPLSFQYLENSIIDYQESNLGAGFKFIIPAATGSCGCGNSFSY